MKAQWLKARQTKYATFATLYILVILCIVTVANILGDRYNKSFDSTANKRYSLSEQTIKIVKGLKQDATITYFGQTTGIRSVKDTFNNYATLSPKVHVEYVDIDKNPMQARENNITSYGISIVQIGAKKEQAKNATEEDITGAFIRDLKNTARTICFVSGSGEHSIESASGDGLSQLKDLLGKEDYSTKSIGLLEKAEVPGDCTAVVVAGPTRDYLQPEVDALKKYVEGGGRAVFMLDAPLKIGRAQIADNNALANLLQGWGVTPQKNLILDFNPIGQLVGQGPQFTLVTSYSTHPIVSSLGRTATGLPFARSLEIKNGDKTSVQRLFGSSESSIATTKLNSPEINAKDPSNLHGPLTIAAAGTYNTGLQNSQGRFVVIGSSGWTSNSYIEFNGNGDLALDTVNWLASDEDLISIRPKSPDDRPITMNGGQLRVMYLTSLLLLPGAMIVTAISAWSRRR